MGFTGWDEKEHSPIDQDEGFAVESSPTYSCIVIVLHALFFIVFTVIIHREREGRMWKVSSSGA
jgi:hypothetical protein